MVQEAVVAVAVVSAFAAAAWKLMPARRRLWLLRALDRRAAARPGLAGWRQRVLQPRIARAAGTGCAGCAANVGVKPHPPPR